MKKKKRGNLWTLEAVNRRNLLLPGAQPDKQQDAVYAWEWEGLNLPDTEDWIPAQVQRFINRVWRAYFDSPPPQFDDGRGRSTAYARGDFTLCLPRWARNRSLVLHELTHAMLWKISPRLVEGHGPEYVRLYIELMDEWGVTPRDRAEKKAKEFKLKMAPRNSSWLPVRKRYRKRMNEAAARKLRSFEVDRLQDDWLKGFKGGKRNVD